MVDSGVASWYGPKFHGKMTANGERYDMDKLTAAHRTLPFNTYVKVVNQDNGESVIVRINDRGPFRKNRVIDLSRAAARKIDMLGHGTAHVKLYVVKGYVPHPSTTDVKNETYTVQLGSFRERSNAEEKARLINGSKVVKVKVKRHTFYRIYYGRYTNKEKAEEERKDLHDRGYFGYVKQLENDL